MLWSGKQHATYREREMNEILQRFIGFQPVSRLATRSALVYWLNCTYHVPREPCTVIYCCKTNCWNAWNNNKCILSHTFSEGQLFWTTQWGGFGSGLPMKLQSWCWLELVNRRLNWGWRIMWSCDGHAWKVRACWQKISVLHHMDVSIGLLDCPYDMTGSFLQSEVSKKWRESLKWLSQPSVRSYTLTCLKNPTGYTCGRGLT